MIINDAITINKRYHSKLSASISMNNNEAVNETVDGIKRESCIYNACNIEHHDDYINVNIVYLKLCSN